jgi:hypothetical protein
VLLSVGHFTQLITKQCWWNSRRKCHSHKPPYLKEKYCSHDVYGGHNVVSDIKLFLLLTSRRPFWTKPLNCFRRRTTTKVEDRNPHEMWTGPVINLEAIQELPHVDGYSRLKSSPRHDTHSSLDIRWSWSMSHIFVKFLTQRFGFTTFLASLRRSRYSILSKKLSLFVSITENFQPRTCRSESCGAVCASVPTGPNMRAGSLQTGDLTF